MALAQMEALAAETRARFVVRAVSIIHRLGRWKLGRRACWSWWRRRTGRGVDACRWVIDMLKKTVPIWRKNTLKMARSGPTERHFPKKSGGREARRAVGAS